MTYRVTHTTTYEYSEPVSLSHGLVHLAPRDGPHQTCNHRQLLISPMPAVSRSRVDYFGNQVTFFTVQEPHQKLVVTAHNTIQVSPSVPPNPADTPPWEQVREQLASDRNAESLEAYQFAFDSPYVKSSPELTEYAGPSFCTGRPLLDAVLDLTQRIHDDFRYDKAATNLATPLPEVLRVRRGVCQDFAHLQIGCFRALGLCARYVSGYLLTNPPPGQPRLIGADASHAWLSIYCPGFGWIDVDPTNGHIPSDKHITLAWGRDYEDVSPIKGVILGGGQHVVHVAVDVAASDGPG